MTSHAFNRTIKSVAEAAKGLLAIVGVLGLLYAGYRSFESLQDYTPEVVVRPMCENLAIMVFPPDTAAASPQVRPRLVGIEIATHRAVQALFIRLKDIRTIHQWGICLPTACPATIRRSFRTISRSARSTRRSCLALSAH